MYVIIINIVIIILCVLDYQVYITTKASVEVTTNEIHLLVPVKLNDVKYYTNNNYLLIEEKEYPYHIYKIDSSLSIDETGENYQLLKLIILLGNILISGIILGKKATSKGYLEGIKLGIFMIILFTLITLITGQGLKLKLLLYDSIILITAILGGMIGINKK